MTEDARITWLRSQIRGRLESARGLAASLAGGDGAAWAYGHAGDFDYTVYPRARPLPHEAVADTWREDVTMFIAANDPQQVTADCEAQLRLLGKIEAMDDAGYLLPDLATIYRHNPGYRDHWG